MARDESIKSVLVIGSGPIVIGQACEFDYSGTQACKALREEGYKVILINSNPATIMTDPNLADRTYIEPINADIVEKIIAKERPDAVLPTVGGQTALNCAIDLAKKGVLEKYGVEHPMFIQETKDKIIATCLEKFGVENPFMDSNRIQTIFKNKYGVNHPSKVNEFYKKLEDLNLKKIGYKSPLSSPIIREKINNKMLNKYGTITPMKSDKIRDCKISNDPKYCYLLSLCASVCYLLHHPHTIDDHHQS